VGNGVEPETGRKQQDVAKETARDALDRLRLFLIKNNPI